MDTTVKKNKIYYGWVMVFVNFVVYGLMACFPGQCMSLITSRMVRDAGWSEAMPGLATSNYYIALAVLCVPCAILVRKLGHKKAMILCGIIGAIPAVIHTFGLIENPRLYVTTFLLFGFLGGGVGIAGASTIVIQWFHRRKGVPMGIFACAGGVAGLILPVVTQRIINTSGVQAGWGLFVGMLFTGIVLMLIFYKDGPEDVGDVIDGRDWVASHPPTEAELKNERPASDEPSLSRCYRSKEFVFICIQLFGNRAIVATFSTYIVLYAGYRNIDAMWAASLISIFNGIGIFTRFSGGFAETLHINKRTFNVIAYAISSIGFCLMYFAATPALFVVCAILIAIGFGWATTNQSMMMPEIFGYKNFVIMTGSLNTLGFIGSTVMPMFVYALCQYFGGYQYGYLGFGLVLAVCCLTAVFTKCELLNDKAGEKKKAVVS